MNLAQIERDISRQQLSFVCFCCSFFLSFRGNKWIQSSAAVKQVYSEMIGIQIVRPRFCKYFQNKIARNEPIYVNQALKKHWQSTSWSNDTFIQLEMSSPHLSQLAIKSSGFSSPASILFVRGALSRPTPWWISSLLLSDCAVWSSYRRTELRRKTSLNVSQWSQNIKKKMGLNDSGKINLLQSSFIPRPPRSRNYGRLSDFWNICRLFLDFSFFF